jgi:hypothetical protein
MHFTKVVKMASGLKGSSEPVWGPTNRRLDTFPWRKWGKGMHLGEKNGRITSDFCPPIILCP